MSTAKLSTLQSITEALKSTDLLCITEDLGLGDFSARKMYYSDFVSSIYRDISANFTVLRLSDVNASTITNGQTLAWNSVSQKFVASDISTGGVADHDIASNTHDYNQIGSLTNGDILYFNGSNWNNIQLDDWIDNNYDYSVLRNLKFVSTNYVVPSGEIGYNFITASNNIHYSLPYATSNELTGLYYTFCRNQGDNSITAVVVSAHGKIADSENGLISSVLSAENFANITLLNISSNNWIVISAHGTWVTN